MQLVTFDELKQLETDSSVQEADYALDMGLSFKDVCSTYSTKKKEFIKDNSQLWRKKTYDWMKSNYLKYKCPPIKLVGVGSSRTAYACIGGKCLKVAMNDAGAAQNKQEQKYTCKKHWWTTTYACFVNTYGFNEDYGLLLSECCAKSNQPNALAVSFSMYDIHILSAVVKAICKDENHDIRSASNALKDMAIDIKKSRNSFSSKYADVAEKGAEWLQNLQSLSTSKMTPGQKSFMQLVKFWKKNGTDELLPGDVITEDNWGFAIRDGKIAPVMLDVGFSKSVASRYYSF